MEGRPSRARKGSLQTDGQLEPKRAPAESFVARTKIFTERYTTCPKRQDLGGRLALVRTLHSQIDEYIADYYI